MKMPPFSKNLSPCEVAKAVSQKKREGELLHLEMFDPGTRLGKITFFPPTMSPEKRNFKQGDRPPAGCRDERVKREVQEEEFQRTGEIPISEVYCPRSLTR